MNLQEIRKIAKKHDIKSGKLRKRELIQAVQTAEGNIPCYGTDADGSCDQTACLWREDCAKDSKPAK